MAAWHMPRLVIAAPHSHSGKTTVTLALLAGLRQRGMRVAPFKVGPDYIDPQLHRQAAGNTSYNLDTYLIPAGQVQDTFCRVAHDADVAIIEGVMGLFDGSSPTSRSGSTAEVAVLLRAPIVLVIDASGMAASVGALIHGFRTYDPEVRVAGVILNRLGSAGHMRYLVPAIEREGVEILGYLPKDVTLTIPERHLGLLPTAEEDRVTPLLGHLTALASRCLDLDRVLQLAHTAPVLTQVSPATASAEGRQLNGAPFPATAWAEGGQFNGPPSLPEGYRGEVNLAVEDWTGQLAKALDRGFILTIDYGQLATDLYSRQNHQGTLVCYHRHAVSSDPYQHLGQQDITCQVDFTSLMRLGDQHGLATVGYTLQRQFLTNLGFSSFLDALQTQGLSAARTALSRMAMMTLVDPDEYGDFKVLAQAKGHGLGVELLGFAHQGT